jgi:hypothetical protein
MSKHLNQEDIESFGFKYIKNTSNDSEKRYMLGNVFTECKRFPGEVWGYFSLSHHLEENLIEINGKPELMDQWIGVFLGEIKNKSELKKVLQMIGVIEYDN